MNHTAHPAAPLRFAQVIGLAEAGAIDHAFHNLLGYGAAVMNQRGDRATSAACRAQMVEEKRQAGLSARQALSPASQPLQRLEQWFHVRGFDQEADNQKLASELERHVQHDFPALFAASQAWLRRGLAPQAGLVRAVEQAQSNADPQGLARDLADWVWRMRSRRLELLRIRQGEDKDLAGEAIFETRAYRDYHLRILLGLTKPHEVGDLEAVDTALALAISAIWSDDQDEQQPNDGEIVARLIQCAGYTYQRHPVALSLYQHLSTETASSREESGAQR